MNLREHIKNWECCERCIIGEWAYRHVFYWRRYKSTDKAQLLFIGEGPGPVEDYKGFPFVGPAGKFLREEIKKIKPKPGLNYMFTNIVACQPKDLMGGKFREPSEHEILNCEERLTEFLDIVQPNVLCLLGKIAYWNAPILINSFTEFDLQHPSFILRNGGTDAPEYIFWQKELEEVIRFAESYL